MALTKEVKYDKIEVVGDNKHVQIRQTTVVSEDGVELSRSFHRYVLHPDDDISGETQTIQRGTDENGDPIMKTVKEIAEELWTDEVKTSWTTFKAEQEARMNPE